MKFLQQEDWQESYYKQKGINPPNSEKEVKDPEPSASVLSDSPVKLFSVASPQKSKQSNKAQLYPEKNMQQTQVSSNPYGTSKEEWIEVIPREWINNPFLADLSPGTRRKMFGQRVMTNGNSF